MTETGTAILVDGENISHAHASRILSAAAALAPIRVARVYGHVPQINGWAATAGFVPVHTARATDGADLVLAIEAVALSHAPVITHLVIATSDGGLAPLVHHLRAAGRSVLLLCEAKAPEALRLAASQVRVLGSDAKPAAPAEKHPPAGPTPKKPVVLAPKPGLDDAIRRLVGKTADGTRLLPVSVLGQRLGAEGFRIKALGSATWTAYLRKRPDLCRIEGDGAEKTIRLL